MNPAGRSSCETSNRSIQKPAKAGGEKYSMSGGERRCGKSSRSPGVIHAQECHGEGCTCQGEKPEWQGNRKRQAREAGCRQQN